MKQCARRKRVTQPPDEPIGIARLGWPDRIGVPLGRFNVSLRHKGRLAARSEPHVLRNQILVHARAEIEQRRPARVREGCGNPHCLGNPRHLHLNLKINLRRFPRSGDRRGRAIMRCGGQRNMPLARKQSRRRIKADPTRAGQINLRPSVQIRKVRLWPLWSFNRLNISLHLDQIARDKSRRIPERPQHLHLQPSAVTARSGRQRKRLLRRLHARLHPNNIADAGLKRRVEGHQKINRPASERRELGNQRLDQRPLRFTLQIRPELRR